MVTRRARARHDNVILILKYIEFTIGSTIKKESSKSNQVARHECEVYITQNDNKSDKSNNVRSFRMFRFVALRKSNAHRTKTPEVCDVSRKWQIV